MKEKGVRWIDRYEIQETLQTSADGVVYRAAPTQLENTVIIKTYYPSLHWSPQISNEFLTQVNYLRFIEHETLLPILDFGKHEGAPYVVYADPGLTLLSQGNTRHDDPDEVLDFLHKIAECLAFLHKQEIVHGTLSPETLVIDAGGAPQLMDYGLSTIFKKVLRENMDDGFGILCVANPLSTSPEQLTGSSPSRSSDIYALGIVAYYYIFGEYPFDLIYVSSLVAHQEDTRSIRRITWPGTLPKVVLNFVEKCIQIPVKNRFATVAQAMGALDRILAGRSIRLMRKRMFVVETLSTASRVRRAYVGAAILFIGLLVYGLSFVFNMIFTSPGGSSTPALPAAATVAQAIQPQAAGMIETSTPNPYADLPVTEPSPSTLTRTPAIQAEEPDIPSQPITWANLSSLEEISRLGFGRPEELTVSPDQDFIAVATSTGVYIFRAGRLQSWLDTQGWATSIQFSPDGATLAVGLLSGDIQLWNWQPSILTQTLTGHTGKINRILFSKNNLMYTASADRQIIVWRFEGDTIDGVPIPAHSRPVNDIAVTSDGRTIISCSDDALIRVWDVNSRRKLYELPFDEDGNKAKAIAISSDDLYFAAGGDSGYLRQWNLITAPSVSNPLPTFRTDPIPVKSIIWSLQYIRNDTELLAGIDDGLSRRYDADRKDASGTSRRFIVTPPPRDLVDIFGPAFQFSSSVAAIGENILSSNWDGKVTRQGEQLLPAMYDSLDRIDISSDGTIVAAGGKRNTVSIWNLNTNELLYQDSAILPYGDPISPDGSSVAIIVLSDIRRSETTGNLIREYLYQMRALSGTQSSRELSAPIPGALVNYALDGTVFVAGNGEDSKSWDFASGYETYGTASRTSGCRVTASRNDSKQTLQVYSPAGVFTEWREPQTSKLCQMISQFSGGPSAISKNLALLVYSRSNAFLDGYSLDNDAILWTYPLTEKISALGVSPNGEIVAVGYPSGKLVLLDGRTGIPGGEVVGNLGVLRAIEFSNDSKLLVTAGDDGAVRVFGIADS